jgi:type IV secretory pathway TrbF-like protein
LSDALLDWRAVAIFLAALLVFSMWGNVRLALEPVKVEPYLLHVKQHARDVLYKSMDLSRVDPRLVMSHIGLFIYNSRTRFMDVSAQIKFTPNSYLFVAPNSPAQDKLDAYFLENPPINVPGPTLVEIETVVPLSANAYTARWHELVVDAKGALSLNRYEGFFRLADKAGAVGLDMGYADDEYILDNPMGIYIIDYVIEALRTTRKDG